MVEKKSSKDLLIETASRLFRLRGYDGVGLNDILKESKIPKGSMYHHFPGGKEELAVSAIHFTKELAIQDLERMLGQFDDPVKGFQAYILDIANNIGKDPDFAGLPFGTLVGEKHSSSELIRLACEESFKELEAVYQENLVKSGIQKERAKDLSVLLNALIEGAIVLSLAEKSGKPIEIVANQLPQILVQK